MPSSVTREEYDQWLLLREDVWRGREGADIAKRYYKKRAGSFQFWSGLLTTASLIVQSGGVAALFVSWPKVATGLAALAGVLSVVNATQGWPRKRVDHLLAAQLARRSYGRWNTLWRDAREYTNPAKLRKRIDEANEKDQEILDSVVDSTDRRTWRAMEDEVLGSYDPQDLATEQPEWIAK